MSRFLDALLDTAPARNAARLIAGSSRDAAEIVRRSSARLPALRWSGRSAWQRRALPAMTPRQAVLGAAAGAALGAVALAAANLRFDVDPVRLEDKYANPPSRFVVARGIRFHLRERGTGPVVVLLHGQAINLSAWEPAAVLLAESHRVISVDLPGHGLTGPDPRGRYALAELAESLDALMRELGIDRFALAGNSLGGGVALRYALAHAQKLRALILVDAVGAPQSGPGPLAFRLKAMDRIGQLVQWFIPKWTVRFVLADTFGEPRNLTDDLVTSTYELLLRAGNRRAGRRTLLGALDPQIAARIGEIGTPTLILWGARDTWIRPTDAHWFAENLRDARLTVFDGLGHMPMLEDPEATVTAIDAFLAALPG